MVCSTSVLILGHKKWVFDYEDVLRISSLCTPLKTFILATTKNQPTNETMKISLVSVFCFHSFQVGSQVLKILRFPHFKLALMALASQVVKKLDLIFMWFPLFKLTRLALGGHVVKKKISGFQLVSFSSIGQWSACSWQRGHGDKDRFSFYLVFSFQLGGQLEKRKPACTWQRR